MHNPIKSCLVSVHLKSVCNNVNITTFNILSPLKQAKQQELGGKIINSYVYLKYLNDQTIQKFYLVVYEAPALWYDDALINKELGFASMRRNIDLPTVDPFAYLHDP